MILHMQSNSELKQNKIVKCMFSDTETTEEVTICD